MQISHIHVLPPYMNWNLSWYWVIRFICTIALLCLMLRMLYTSILMTLSRPIESIEISSAVSSVLALFWFLVSESHSDISTANRLHIFPLSTLAVFISLPMQYSHTLFLWAVWFSAWSGTSGLTTFCYLWHFFMSDPFLNCIQIHFCICFLYSSEPSLPTENPTPLKNSSAANCFFLFLFLPPFYLKPWNLLSCCSPTSPFMSEFMLVLQ